MDHLELVEKVTGLAREPTVNFYELSVDIASLSKADRSLVRDVLEKSRMGRRRFYYLLAVGRLIKQHKIAKEPAERVGWTKLQIIAHHVKGQNYSRRHIGSLIRQANELNVQTLIAHLKGEKQGSTKAVVFHLSKEQQVELAYALMAYGAKHGRNGMIDRENALIKIAKAAISAVS